MKGDRPQCRVIVSYTPLSDEVDPVLFSPPLPLPSFIIPQDKSIDPFLYAHLTVEKLQNYSSIGILVPGQRFDRQGTRHGRGGGWYDRFLSKVPTHWLKIGALHQETLSPHPLKREEWDIPMDYLAIVDNDTMVQFIHI